MSVIIKIKTITLTPVIVILCLFIVQSSISGQSSNDNILHTIDSLEKCLKTAKEQDRLLILNKLTKDYIEISIEKSMLYGNAAIELAKKIGNKKQKATALTNIGIVFYNKGNYDKSLKYFKNALKLFKEENDMKEIAVMYGNIGLIYNKQSNYEKALNYHNKSLEIEQKINNKEGIASSLLNIGNVYKICGNYEKALQYYDKSLKISQKHGDKKEISRVLNNIGLIYYNWNNYEKAIEYFNNSLDLIKTDGNIKRTALILNNLGNVYNDIQDYEKAIEYYNFSLKLKQKFGNKEAISNTLNNIGTVYNDLGNLKKAEEYYNKSLEICKEIGDKQGIAITQINIGHIYFDLGNYEKAKGFYIQSLQIALALELKGLIYNNYKNLSEIYSETKDFKKAFDYQIKYSEIKDSVFNEKSRQEITKLEVLYETEKKENKIILLQKNQKIQELKYFKEKKTRNLYGIAVILVSSFILILLYFYLQKQKAYNILVKKNVEIAKKEIEFEKIGDNDYIQEREIINEQEDDKYTGSVLDKKRKKKLLKDIITLMERKKHYLNPQFTIGDCAKELETNRKYISQVINEKLKTNFNNFINEYRVKEVRKYLINPEFDNYSLSGIALMSGFHSKATFYGAFKKYTGITPSFFKKKNR